MAGAYMHYRMSSVGVELQKCLDELVNDDSLDPEQARTILEQFDKAISSAIANDVKTKAVIKGPLRHYRNHDDIWTFYMENVEVKLENTVTIASEERMRIVSVGRR